MTLRVLTVDDEADVQLVCRVSLERAGFAVCQATNGEEALRVLEACGAFDLILLDAMMPVMDGWELMEHLAGDPDLRAIPVVMFSAYTDTLAERSVAAGARAYVEKPFSPSQLVRTIQSVLS